MSGKVMFMKEDVMLNVDELRDFLSDNDVLLPHVKLFVEELGADMSHISTMFNLHVPAILKVESYPHEKDSVNKVLRENMSLELVLAVKSTIGMKNRIDTLTTIPLLMAANQLNKFQVEFRGGDNPVYHIGKIDEDSQDNGFNELQEEMTTNADEWERDDDEYPIFRVNQYATSRESQVGVMVCSGLPIIKDNDLEVLENEYGMTDIIAVRPDAANLAHLCAGALDIKMVQHKDRKTPELMYHKFGDTKQFALSKPYFDNMLTTPTMSKCRQLFALPSMSKEAMVHEVATYLSFHIDRLKAIPRSEITEVVARSGYRGKKFTDQPIAYLENMWDKLRSTSSRYLTLLKNQDTGFASINAPLKWSPVMAYINQAVPYEKDEDKTIRSNPRYNRNSLKCIYYGAAGGRMDAMMRSYFSNIQGRDIAPFSAVSKKVDPSELQRLKVPKWEFGDITAYKRGDEHVMVSDVYMKPWSTSNALMSKFVAGLLQGNIVSGNDVTSYGNTAKFTVAAKMIMPKKENLGYFEGAYPFILAYTCRPTTSEIILIKDFDAAAKGYPDHDDIISNMEDAFGDQSFKNRFTIIKNEKEFEHMLKLKYASQLCEVFLHLDKLTTDWTTPFNSPKNRKWFLAGPQIPNLYRTMKINMDTGFNAWSFDPTVSALLKVDLEGFSLGIEAEELKQEQVVKKKKPKEEKKKDKNKDEGVLLRQFNPNDKDAF